MTRDSYLAALAALDLNQRESAKLLGVNERTVRKWLEGYAPVPQSVELLLQLMVKHRISVRAAQKLLDPPTSSAPPAAAS